MRLVCAFLVLLSGPALAQGVQGFASNHVWQPVPDVTSADLAAYGWTVTDAAGLSMGGEQDVVVTFWEHTVYNTHQVMRCIATFDAALTQVAEVCSQPGHAAAQP